MKSRKKFSRIFLFSGFLTLAAVGLFVHFHTVSHPDAFLSEASSRTPIVDSSEKNLLLSSRHVGLQGPNSASFEFNHHAKTANPNSRGEYPRVVVDSAGVVAIRVSFHGLGTGESIRVQSEDGAALLGVAAGGSLALDANSDAIFDVKLAQLDGAQRITLRRGSQTRLLEFWVGSETPLLVRK